MSSIEKAGLATPLHIDLDGSFHLANRTTYVFKTRERLTRRLANANIYGQATAKSTIGRIDVLIRLIVDGMGTYEHFEPGCFQQLDGDMYLEITPITFDVRVRPGDRLSQLRFCIGPFDNAELAPSSVAKIALRGCADDNDGYLSVELSDIKIGRELCAALCATPSDEAIPLWEKEAAEKPNPIKFWKRIRAGERKRIKIEKGNFYILRSKELMALPSGIAVYCKASDETIGEMRIHYAGFVHPWFGRDRDDGKIGTPLIFELRGHQVDVSLADGERLANLVFYRMSNAAVKERENAYSSQTLQLSKIFGAWPTDE